MFTVYTKLWRRSDERIYIQYYSARLSVGGGGAVEEILPAPQYKPVQHNVSTRAIVAKRGVRG